MWGRWPATEGGYLIDLVGLVEVYLVVTGRAGADDPDLASRAEALRRALPRERSAARRAYEEIFESVLAAGAGRCPHGLPIGVDLAVSEPFFAADDLEIVGESLAPAEVAATADDLDTVGDRAGSATRPSRTARPAVDASATRARRSGEGVHHHRLALLAGPAQGSGRSPWTRALLEQIGRQVRAGDRVADIGTGTGILGLYAAARGAREVDLIDRDRIAAAVAARNARLNPMPGQVRAHRGSAECLTGSYDLLIVSLGGLDEVASVLPAAARHLRSGGTLLASPAMGEAEAERLRALIASAGLRPIETLEREGWHVVVARTPD